MDKKGNRYAVWNMQVTKILDGAVEKAVKENAHNTKSEFIRDAVRKELERRSIL